AALALWEAALQSCAAVHCIRIDDPTGNPLQRLRVRLLPDSGWSARSLADALAAGTPSVRVRDYQTDLGHIDLDPCNLHDGEAQIVAHRLLASLQSVPPTVN
ncbi:MAG: hypothetical protein ABIR55_03300, partial [Burkholderiaceae bacterium]